jgi:indole-3-glycerol phosphate synthase
VAESGVNTLDDVNSIVSKGYRVALIGTTLMKAPQPRELLGKMLATGRQTAMGMATRKLRIAKGEVS